MEVKKIPKDAAKVQSSLGDLAKKIESNMASQDRKSGGRNSSRYSVRIEHRPHLPDQDSPQDRYHIFVSTTTKNSKSGKTEKEDLDPIVLKPHEFIKRTLAAHGQEPGKFSAITHDDKNPKNFTVRTWG